MTTEETIDRNRIITEWFFYDWIGDREHLPGSEDVFLFMKIMIDVVSIFGTINEQERKYIIGRGAILGVTNELLKELERYEPCFSDDINEVLEGFNQIHVKKTRMGIIYNLLRMFGDQNKLDSKTLDTIHMLAGKLGATKEQVQQLHELYHQEEQIRRQRAVLLFPHGFQDALIEYQKIH